MAWTKMHETAPRDGAIFWSEREAQGNPAMHEWLMENATIVFLRDVSSPRGWWLDLNSNQTASNLSYADLMFDLPTEKASV